MAVTPPDFKTGEWAHLGAWTDDGYFIEQHCRPTDNPEVYECWYVSYRQDPYGAPVKDDVWRDDIILHRGAGEYGEPVTYWDH